MSSSLIKNTLETTTLLQAIASLCLLQKWKYLSTQSLCDVMSHKTVYMAGYYK